MSTITKERLLKIQQWRETYGVGSNVVLPAEEAEELARIALESYESHTVKLPSVTPLIQRMKAAAEKATEGPWIIFDDDWSDDEDAVITNEARDDACASPIAIIKGGGTESCSSSPFYAEQRANAAFIALASPDNVRALVEALESLRQQLAAVVAELSAIDAINNDAVFITDEHYEQRPPEVQKMIGALAVLKIPACDAYLAEVRAQSFSEPLDAFSKDVALAGLDDSSTVTIFECKDALKHVAEQLRQGEKL